MDVHASLEAPCDADVLFGLVDDLSIYPHWIDLVHRADALSDGEWDVVSDAVWLVELRARINRGLVEGAARVADEHAADLHLHVEVVKP